MIDSPGPLTFLRLARNHQTVRAVAAEPYSANLGPESRLTSRDEVSNDIRWHMASEDFPDRRHHCRNPVRGADSFEQHGHVLSAGAARRLTSSAPTGRRNMAFDRSQAGKTATLFVLGAETGARIAGVPEPEVQAVRGFTRDLGLEERALTAEF